MPESRPQQAHPISPTAPPQARPPSTTSVVHWFRFRALFAALPEETLMAKIMSWRTMDLSEYEGSMRVHYAELQERFALPPELRGGAARVVSVEEHDAAFLARFRH